MKRLTSFKPEYRLRIGNYRVLFEVIEGTIESIASCTAGKPTVEEEAMIGLHPEYLTRQGKPKFAVLPIEDFDHLKSYLEDLLARLDALAGHRAALLCRKRWLSLPVSTMWLSRWNNNAPPA